MADKFSNIKALLGKDKPLYNAEDPSDLRYPAYEQMLDNSRRNYVRDVQAPEYTDAFADRKNQLENKMVRSEPTALDKIADNSVSKDFLNKLHQENILKSDLSQNNHNKQIDRTGINNEIIKAYMRDINPSLAYRLDNQRGLKNDAEAEDNIRAVYNEAEKAVKTKDKVPLTMADDNVPYAGAYLHDSKTIDISPKYSSHPGHLQQFVSTPFHERMHVQHNELGIANSPKEDMPDFSNSNKLDVDMARAQNRHMPFSAAGTIAPEDYEKNLTMGQLTRSIAPGESGKYFKMLRQLIGKPIPEKE